MNNLSGLVAIEAHYAGMVNSVSGLYVTFRHCAIPFFTREMKMEGWGQLCFDDAAQRITAYNMHNRGMVGHWRPLTWRVDMSGEPVGGAKRSGEFPDGFDPYVKCPELRR